MLQMGVGRFPVQDVPVRTLAQLHRINIHLGGYMHRAIFRHYPPNYLQANIDADQATRKYHRYSTTLSSLK